MKPESFVRGAIILTIAGMIVKVLGALYRIPFTRLVGSEGVGLYQMAYPIYATILALSTSGIPVAISLLVAEKGSTGEHVSARQAFLTSLAVLFLLGLFFTCGLIWTAPYLANVVLGDGRAYLPLVSVAPAILVISVVSAFRGYFQGWQLMWPTAVSQVVEQVIRVATVFWAALTLLPQGVEYAAAGATFGAFTGGCGGLLVLLAVYWWFEKQMQVPVHRYRRPLGSGEHRVILRRLLAYALPVSAGSLVMPLVQAIDTIIIPHRLRVLGYSAHAATSLFGQLSGMAGTLVYLPAVFTVSLSSTLVPHLASAITAGNRAEVNTRLLGAMRFTMILSLPCTIGLMVLATPIMNLLFGDPRAGAIMAWLAPAAYFSGLQQTSSGALQGLGKTLIPVVNLLAGCAVKVCCNYYLTVIPSLGINGAAIGSIAGFALAYLLNYLALRLCVGYHGPVLLLPRPLLAAAAMGVSLPIIYSLTGSAGNLVATIVTVLLGAVIYGGMLLVTGEISLQAVRKRFRI